MLDWWTGGQISFSIFYLLPISWVALAAGPWPGVLVALAGAAVWLVADLAAGTVYSHPLIPLWNMVMRGMIFLLVTLLLTRLNRALAELRRLTLQDPLTLVGNPRYLSTVGARELERSRRSGAPLSVAYFDLDDFKLVNDRLGHRQGDRLLTAVGAVMKERIRAVDCLARVGGDEFVLLMPDTDLDGARVLLERLRDALTETFRATASPVSVSIGLACFTAPPESLDDLVREADRLMYQAKNGGKNAIEAATIAPLDRQLSRPGPAAV